MTESKETSKGELKRGMFAGWRLGWSWQLDIGVLFVLGFAFLSLYAPGLVTPWIILFVASLGIGHLAWLNKKITLSDDLVEMLTKEAEIKGLTFAETVEEIVREHFKKKD